MPMPTPSPLEKKLLGSMSRRKFAAKANLSPSYVARVLKGERRLSFGNAQRWAMARGIAIDDLWKLLTKQLKTLPKAAVIALALMSAWMAQPAAMVMADQATAVVPNALGGGGASTAATNIWTGSQTFTDTLFTLQDNLDNTKKAQFQLSGLSTASTRTFILQNSAGDLTLASLEMPNTFTGANSIATLSVTALFALSTRTTATVDGATTFAAGTSSYIVLACTGAETINTITSGATGRILIIENSDTECTIADDDDPTAANAVNLTGVATSDVGAVAKVISLIYNGTSWLQVSESAN